MGHFNASSDAAALGQKRFTGGISLHSAVSNFGRAKTGYVSRWQWRQAPRTGYGPLKDPVEETG